MPFVVKAYIDDAMLSAKAGTAKEAFAKAIEWHVAQRLTGVSISDGIGILQLPSLHQKWLCRRSRIRSMQPPTGVPRFPNDEALSDLPSARSPPVLDVRRLGAASQVDPGR
jgi:hypothetical protein